MLLPTKCHKLCVCVCVPFRLCLSLHFSLTVAVSISFAHCLWHVWYIFRLWELRLQHHKMSAWCVGLAAKCCQMSILHGSLHLPLSLSLCFSPLSHSLAHFICCSLNAVKIDQTWVCKRVSRPEKLYGIFAFSLTRLELKLRLGNPILHNLKLSHNWSEFHLAGISNEPSRWERYQLQHSPRLNQDSNNSTKNVMWVNCLTAQLHNQFCAYLPFARLKETDEKVCSTLSAKLFN